MLFFSRCFTAIVLEVNEIPFIEETKLDNPKHEDQSKILFEIDLY